MQAILKLSLSFGLVSATLGQGWANAQSFDISQAVSPYQQLLSTKECIGCNLSNVNLRGLDLSGANLENANLSNADLSSANLSRANLTGANFYLSNLSQSNLSQANLTRTNLSSANVAGASLNQASLVDSTATYADLSNVDLSDSNVQDSNLSDANLTGANFSNATISNTNFNYSNLEQADLSTASLTSSSLETASLDGARLPAGESLSVAQSASEQEVVPDTSEETSSSSDADEKEVVETPLTTQAFQQTSAETLPPGTFVGRVGARLYDLPNNAAGTNDTAFYPNFQFSAGVVKDLEISGSYQQADSNSPGIQGPFNVNRGGQDPGNDEATIAAKYRFWKSPDKNVQASVVGALSFGNRQATFNGNGPTVRLENDSIVPMLQVPVTAKLGDRTRATIAPTVAFFADSNALFLFRPPVQNNGEDSLLPRIPSARRSCRSGAVASV